MISEVHELRYGKSGSIKKKYERTFEHEFSAQNNVHKGSNQIKALQTL